MLKGCLVPHPPLIVLPDHAQDIPATRRAYEEIAADIQAFAPETVVIISPHSLMYSDYFHIAPGAGAQGDFAAFRAPEIKAEVTYDTELAELIGVVAGEKGLSAGTLGEKQPLLDHGVLVPLYFFHSPRIVRLSLSGFSLLDHYRYGICLREAIERLGRRVYIVASGDMSHKLKVDGPYGFAPEGPQHDALVCDYLAKGDFAALVNLPPAIQEAAAECGLKSIVILAGALDGLQTESRVLSYEGPFGVGYLCATFAGEGEAESLLPRLNQEREDLLAERRAAESAYVNLARRNVEQRVQSGRDVELPADLPPEALSERAGVFVSIKKDGQLRGCIGTIAPTAPNIAREILKNSVLAAAEDPRFSPIRAEELDSLTYSVDILAAPEPITGPAELDVQRYGIIVTHGGRRGLLLPNLEGVDTVDAQISIALQKGGINATSPYKLERFEVVRHL